MAKGYCCLPLKANKYSFSENKENRGFSDSIMWGPVHGGWDVYYYLYEPGLVVYECEWNNARATTKVIVTVAIVALVTVATIVTEGAAAPAYGLIFA